MARGRSGGCTDFILGRCSKREILASPAPVLDRMLCWCTDGSAAVATAAGAMGIEDHTLK